jgi:hypothetical protein
VDAKTATDILTIVGLIVSLIGGALGAFSIIVTWKLYQAGNSVNLETLKLLHQVSASSHTTEVTSTHYTERLVTGLIDLTQKAMRDNLEWGRIKRDETGRGRPQRESRRSKSRVGRSNQRPPLKGSVGHIPNTGIRSGRYRSDSGTGVAAIRANAKTVNNASPRSSPTRSVDRKASTQV